MKQYTVNLIIYYSKNPDLQKILNFCLKIKFLNIIRADIFHNRIINNSIQQEMDTKCPNDNNKTMF